MQWWQRGGLLGLAVLAAACGPPAAPTQIQKIAVPERRPQPDSLPAPAARIRLTILATNDFHGQLQPLQRHTAEQPPRTYRVGGAEALAATIAELRAADPEGTLLLDGGDFMQGSLLANRFEGAPVRELFALLRYDAVTIGNHEFDYGPVGVPDPPLGSRADPRGALRAWCERVRFPVLSANLRLADGSRLPWSNFGGRVLLRRRGILIGLVGLTTPETGITTMPAFANGLRFEPWLPTVRREARALRAAGAQAVVLLAHGDAECPLPDPAGCRGELFRDLLDHLEPGLVDLVVAGHSHQPMAHRYRGTTVIEACSRGQTVARAVLIFDRRTRRLLPEESRALPAVPVCHDVFGLEGRCGEPSGPAGPLSLNPLLEKHRAVVKRVREVLRPYRDGVAAQSQRVLARAARPLLHGAPSVSEVGTLFATALLSSVPDADGALFNGGSVRAELPAGVIRYADLYEAFPFDNRLATVRLDGATLTRLIERLLDRHGLPLVAGIRLRVGCGPPRKLLAVLDAQGRPIQARRLYKLVLSDFLLTGGDGLGPVLEPLPAADKHIYQDRLIREVIAGHLERQRTPLNSESSPVVSPRRPPLLFEDGPCPQARRRRRPACP